MAKKHTRHRRVARGRLNDRDFEILEHISRYRLTTRDVLHRLFFDDSEINAVSKVVSRLERNHFIKSHPLDGSARYYTLGVSGCKTLGTSLKYVKEFQGQGLAHWLGKLRFCCGQLPERQLLTVREVKKRQPELLIRGKAANNNYYIDREMEHDRDLIGFIRVDHGRDVTSLVTHCQAMIHSRMEYPYWRRIIENRLFVVAIVTAYESKAELLREKIAERNLMARFRVESHESLGPIIAAGGVTRE